MSVTVYLQCKCCGSEAFEWNFTYNLAPMFSEAGIYGVLVESNGRLAEDIVIAIETGLNLMRSDPDRFRPHNPPNGWGSYDIAVQGLTRYVKALQEYPDRMVRIYR